LIPAIWGWDICIWEEIWGWNLYFYNYTSKYEWSLHERIDTCFCARSWFRREAKGNRF